MDYYIINPTERTIEFNDNFVELKRRLEQSSNACNKQKSERRILAESFFKMKIAMDIAAKLFIAMDIWDRNGQLYTYKEARSYIGSTYAELKK